MNHYLISNTSSNVDLGVFEGVDGEDAMRAMLKNANSSDQEPSDDLIATEVPVDNDAFEWAEAHRAEAEADEETYPEGVAALWRHQNGNHFFAHTDEDHVGNGSGATFLATYDLVDRSFRVKRRLRPCGGRHHRSPEAPDWPTPTTGG